MSSSRNVIAPANQPLNLPFQVGNTLQRPLSPPNGFLRVNSQTNYIEVYYNNNWISIMAIGSFAKVAITDPYFMYNILLLTGAGIPNSQNNTFIDSSPNNFTITRNGNSTQGSFSPYNVNWSNYVTSGGNYLAIASNAPTAVQSSNFTLELWVYLTNASANASQAFYSNYSVFATAGSIYFGKHSNQGGLVAVYISSYSTTVPLLYEGSLPPGDQWVHYALVRNNNTFSLYSNGIITSSTASSSYTGAVTGATNLSYIGAAGDALTSYNMQGYISNFRIVNGTALYVGSTFAVPTNPLTAVGGTALLTCQSNRIIDNSINNFALTPAGTMSVQPFSPFTITSTYSTTTTGGSGYFDGTGDYLTAGSSALSLTGDITLECWIYQTAQSSFEMICGDGPNYVAVRSGQINVLIQGQFDYNWTGTVPLNQWVHFALVRQGTTVYVYLNGVSIGTPLTGNTGTWFQTGIFCIGQQGQANFWYYHGYISNFRILNSVALYPNGTTFTPSTTPLTAITNTRLLCNFTNAGIIDNSMQNNLETVGTAKISTTQYKFGGSSMFFDGTSALSIPYNPLLNFGSGNFTIEFWTYVTATPSTEQYFVSVGPAGGGSVFRGWRLAAHNGTAPGIYFMASNIAGSVDTLLGGFPSANVWHHIAIVRNGATIKGYVDGIPLTTTINASTGGITDIVAGDYSFVGAIQGTAPNGRLFYNGYIQDLRITKGYARYIVAFTPPTQALPTY
jgi:hypothetical protein